MKWIEDSDERTVTDERLPLQTKGYEKYVRRKYLFSVLIMMKLQLTRKHCYYMDKKLFELFCIENDFAKYFPKCRHLNI